MEHTFSTINSEYGQNWLTDDPKSFAELGENEIKLRYLEKSLKSKRRLEQMQKKKPEQEDNEDEINEKYKVDKNAVIARKFPFKADEFKYPNDDREKPKSLYIKNSDVYGSRKPNDLELPEKYQPINNTFTKEFNQFTYKNFSLNTAASRSKVHSTLDSII